MKNKNLIIWIISIFFFSCNDIGIENNNSAYRHDFINAFGGSWYEYGWGITQLHDGGFVLTGRREFKDTNSKDMYVIRTDENGLGIWERTFGGQSNEEAYSAIQTPDGNIMTVGYSWSFGNAQEIYIVKIDLYGRKLWENTYGGSNREIAHKAIVNSEGDIIIVGQTNSPGLSHGNDDILIQKIDQDGEQKWIKAYGKQNHEVGYDIVELESGGYLVVGFREFYDDTGKDILIIKIDSEGNQLWEKVIPSVGKYEEIAYSISKSKINGYIVCASTNATGNDWYNPQVFSIDFAGNISWNKIYNGSGLKHTRWVATSTNDGGAAIVGTTNYYYEAGNNEDALLIKIDRFGNKIWDTAIEGGKNDWGWGIIQTFLNEIVIVGSTKSYSSGLYDVLLAKISEPINN